MVRAILLAKAIATSILGFRAAMRASHEPSGIDLRPSQFRRDIAPIISSLRISSGIGRGLARPALALGQAEAVDIHFEDVDVMGESIKQRAG